LNLRRYILIVILEEWNKAKKKKMSLMESEEAGEVQSPTSPHEPVAPF
jgi:hypothetical protein